MDKDIQKRIGELLPGLMKEPRLYVHDIDWQKGTALVIEADSDFYRNAVFLDARALKGIRIGAQMKLQNLFGILEKDTSALRPARFIFHIGHAGSTLVSRLLDELPDTLGLREPLVLRNFSAVRNAMRTGLIPANEGALNENIRRCYKLLTRTFENDQIPVIKATSICNNLSQPLLRYHEENRALCLFVDLETMLANMLMKDEIGDIRGFLDVRVHGLKSHFPSLEIDEKKMSPAEMIALSWLTEAHEFYRLANGPMAERATFLDFDTFLADPAKGIDVVLKGLDLKGDAKALGGSKVFLSYAKQPGFPYNPEDRAHNLKASKAKNAEEIAEGLAFAETLGTKEPALKKTIEKFSKA